MPDISLLYAATKQRDVLAMISEDIRRYGERVHCSVCLFTTDSQDTQIANGPLLHEALASAFQSLKH